MEQKVDGINVLKFAGAFIAFLIGAGFATGQEVFQYFAAYGYEGIWVALGTLLGLGYAGGDVIAVGYSVKFDNTNDIYRYYCGKYIGGFYDYFSTIFIYMSYIVMLAGAGATVAQHYGMAPLTGGLIMLALSVGTVVLGLGKIVDIIGCLGPLIVLIALGVGVGAIMMNPAGISVGAELTKNPEFLSTITRVGNNWIASVASYVGFCMLWLAAFLAALGQKANSTKEALTGTSLGAIGFTLGALILMLGFLAHMSEVSTADIPSLIIAAQIWAPVASAFCIIIMAGIYTTAVPLLWSVSARYAQEKTPKFYALTIGLGIVACVIAFSVNFKTIVNVIYGINGYVGILLIVFMLAKRFGLSKLGMNK